jgi:NitT/TauT family transport system substrate-binding protein
VNTGTRGNVVRTPRTSKTFLRVCLAALAALPFTAVQACAGGDASSGDGKTITFGVSAPAPGGNMLQLGIAQTKSYFSAEGITVKPVFLGTGGAVVQALASGKVQIGTSTPDLVLQAIDRGQDVTMFYNWTTKNVTQFGVLPDSPVRSVADLKGKTVGVQELSAGPAQLAKAAAVNAGLDPAGDLKFIAVGTGAPALDALVRHRVDALVTYDTLFAAMTNGTGQALRFFPPDGVGDLFASSLVASNGWLKDHPAAAAGFGRAWAKASVYADTNPQDGIKMMFAAFPSSKVGAGDQAATKAALAQFKARQQSLYGGGKPPATQQWGAYPPAAVQHWITYAKQQKLTRSELAPDKVYTNEFVGKFNAFDANAIKKAAGSGATP